MKNISLMLMLMAILSLSCRKHKSGEMTVVKDCTGTYLRFQEKDYHVCNPEKLKDYENGTKVNASFRQVKTCTGPEKDAIVCMMYHENEGWIEVKKANK